MIYNKLGRTGLDCSKLGFGTWQIGGGRWKALSTKESVSLLQESKGLGINIFDAAYVYGQYKGDVGEFRSKSLELLRKAFPKDKRSELLICLKIGQLDEYAHTANYDPRQLTKQFMSALKQLNTDYIDICLIHAPTIDDIKRCEALAVLKTLQTLGAVRFIGYSFENEPEHANLAISQNVDVIMLQYNLIEQQCKNIFKSAGEKGIGILVGGPLKRGYLSGRYENISDLPMDDDYWKWNLKYSERKVKTILNEVRRLKKQAGSAQKLREKAFGHILKNEEANSLIVGHRSIEEVKENIATICNIDNKNK